jgi:curved DNA-binding protein CbpA
MDVYYKTLGLNNRTSKAEIKNAYRKLAKKYHPDVSTEPDAEERFLEITEAYEFLTEQPKASTPLHWEIEIEIDEKEIRRQRAREYAQMRFEAFKYNNDAFKKSWYYEPVKITTYAIIYLGYLLAGAMFLAPVLALIFTNDDRAYLMIFAMLFSPHTYKYARELHKGVKPYFENYG